MPTTTRLQSQQKRLDVVPSPAVKSSSDIINDITNDDDEGEEPQPLTPVSSGTLSSPRKRRRSGDRPVVSPIAPAFKSSDSSVSSSKEEAKKTKPKSRKRSSPSKKLKTPTTPPPNWQEIYSLVEELRKDRTAPCDSMGCEALATKGETDMSSYRFQVLVALLLSSQTKDAMVSEAVNMMRDDGILSVAALRQDSVTVELLADKYLAKVGFRNNKAKYLKQVVDILHRDYDSDIPPNASEMMDLPGIGPKMAFICEAVAWDPDVPSGIGVDTHMHRLFNQLGWVKSKTPEQTRTQLESWLPREKWKTVNLLWVGFGQEVQQEKAKILKKGILCSQPAQALRLLQRCGIVLKKEGTKLGLYEDIKTAMKEREHKET